MTSKHFKISLLLIATIILTLGLSISFQSLLAAWTAPLDNPPTCNPGNPGCDEPVNKGSSAQIKGGPLYVNADNTAATGFVAYGNVGIGTASPSYKLDLNAETTNGLRIATSNSSPYAVMINNLTYGNTDAKGFGFWQDDSGYAAIDVNNATRLAILPADGNVGIGTVRPNETIEIATTAGARGIFSDGAGPSRKVLFFEAPGTTHPTYARILSYNYGASSGLNLILNDTGGNVGIGTTAPGYKLDVNGTFRINSASESPLAMTGDTYLYVQPVANSYARLGAWDTSSGALPLVLQSDGGNVGIGTGATNPTAKLTIGGTAGVDGIKFPDGTLQTTAYAKGYTSTVTAAGTTTLNANSSSNQLFTGTNTQTVVLPVASTLTAGWSVIINNQSTGIVTVKTSGGNTIQAMIGVPSSTYNSVLTLTCVNPSGGTGTASWTWEYRATGTCALTGTGFTTSPTLTAYFTVNNKSVTLALSTMVAVSNNTSFYLSLLPSILQPARDQNVNIPYIYNNNSVIYNGATVRIDGPSANPGYIRFLINGNETGFTPSGNKGISGSGGLTLNYSLL